MMERPENNRVAAGSLAKLVSRPEWIAGTSSHSPFCSQAKDMYLLPDELIIGYFETSLLRDMK